MTKQSYENEIALPFGLAMTMRDVKIINRESPMKETLSGIFVC
jgi:hypothetical protein